MKLDKQPKIEDCPKNMNRCVLSNCPMFKDCWAYDKYVNQQEKIQKERDSGWE